MNIKKSPDFDPSRVSIQLEQAAQYIETVKTKFQEENEFNTEITELLPFLESCNQSLADKKLIPDQELDTSVEKLLRALNSFQFIKNDLITQQKVNALQVNLFANIVLQLDNLEQTLNHWKEQNHKVQKTTPSKQV